MNPVWKRDPCQYLVKYSPDVLKKNFYYGQKMFSKNWYKINSSGDMDKQTDSHHWNKYNQF